MFKTLIACAVRKVTRGILCSPTPRGPWHRSRTAPHKFWTKILQIQTLRPVFAFSDIKSQIAKALSQNKWVSHSQIPELNGGKTQDYPRDNSALLRFRFRVQLLNPAAFYFKEDLLCWFTTFISVLCCCLSMKVRKHKNAPIVVEFSSENVTVFLI